MPPKEPSPIDTERLAYGYTGNSQQMKKLWDKKQKEKQQQLEYAEKLRQAEVVAQLDPYEQLIFRDFQSKRFRAKLCRRVKNVGLQISKRAWDSKIIYDKPETNIETLRAMIKSRKTFL